MIPLVLSVAAAVLLYVCLSHWVRRERTVLGLKNAVIVSADDSTRGMSTLCSKRYGLVGRPDQLIRVGRMLIPVEQKPTARRMQQLHVLQLAAQCLLCRKSMVFAHRTGYWCWRAVNRSAFTPALEGRLLPTMAQMRALLRADADPGARWVAAKCRPCGYT